MKAFNCFVELMIIIYNIFFNIFGFGDVPGEFIRLIGEVINCQLALSLESTCFESMPVSTDHFFFIILIVVNLALVLWPVFNLLGQRLFLCLTAVVFFDNGLLRKFVEGII